MSWAKKKLQILYILFAVLTLPLLGAEEAIEYNVEFAGIQESKTLDLLQDVSQLIKLKKYPPKTTASLRRRAERDIPNIVKALHSQAYYNAKVTTDFDFSKHPFGVIFVIETGPVYPIGDLKIYPETLNISSNQLGLCIGAPAQTADINTAEEILIHTLSGMGYPLAKLVKREVFADQKTKDIQIHFYIEPGPLARFGQTNISGNSTVKENFIQHKIDWQYGEVYNPAKIETTMNALEAAGVFSSINITHADEVAADGTLPMTLLVSEGKQRSIGLGLGYSTQRGPGVTGEWEHRNYHGMGEKLRVNIDALLDTQEASVSYLIPDFLRRGQDLIYAVETEHNKTKGYEMTSFSLSGTVERQINQRTSASFGGMYEFLKSSKEKPAGGKDYDTYNLARTPLKLRWSTVNDFLDPIEGATIFLKAIPTLQLIDKPFIYTISTLTGSIYKPLSREKRLIFAAKAYFGSIWGTSRGTIPGSDRFNAGSENTLRGYNYQTVSPLNADADPLGGRSLMIFSLEGRWRATEKWGGVFFYDVGNVYSKAIPQFNEKMLQSIGIGARYFTPVGPLRLDFALPLNRRRAYDKKERKTKFIDKPYQIYFSVGQSF